MNNASDQVTGFILKGYPRLSETFIVNEILLLERLGLKLHIFALRNPGESKVHDTVRRVRAQVTYIPDYFWPYLGPFIKANLRLWWRKPSIYWPAFRFAALRSIRQWSSSTIKRFAQAAYLVQNCLALAPSEKPAPSPDDENLLGHDERIAVSHFHAHFSHGPTTVAFFASWLTSLNYSFSAHAKDIYLQEHDFLRRKIQQARFVVTCTEYNKSHLLQVAGKDASVFRSYHGVDTDFFSLPVKSAENRPQGNSRPRILSVGRLVPKKGFSVLIQALHELQQQGHPFQCTIVGSGPLEAALRRQIADLELSECVELLPQTSQRELFEHFRFAEVFALACEVQEDGDRDGIPNVIVEAMAMGIPIVSTRISGIPECVDHGVNGILVAEKDPSAFAAGMATLLNQPELARQFGRAGREKVEREFDSLRNVERIAAALRAATGLPKAEASKASPGESAATNSNGRNGVSHELPHRRREPVAFQTTPE